jgi:16S rRNA (guanine527-N7)-methyltransferase
VLRAAGIDSFLDIGSGGGYPSLPLASAVAGEVMLVESVAKKARFLEAAVVALGLAGRVSVAARRAEEVAHDPHQRERWPAVTARAVGSLADLVELAFPLLTTTGLLVAWKSEGVDAELAAARRATRALGGGELAVHPVPIERLAGHRLVVATKRGRSPDAYPRDPAARRRRPW